MEERTMGKWLRWANRWLLPVALVAAISVAAVTLISAAERSSEEQNAARVVEHRGGGDKDHGKRNQLHDLGGKLDDLAELVGTDADGLKSAYRDGQNLAEIAESNGIDPQTVIDALLGKANERVNTAVEDGKISESRAESIRANLEAKVSDRVHSGREATVDRQEKRAHRDAKFSESFSDLAAQLGTDLEGLKSAYGEGQSLAQLAESNGIDPQTVIDVLVARASERIDAAVEAGKLSAEQAETWQSDLEARISERVHSPMGQRRKG